MKNLGKEGFGAAKIDSFNCFFSEIREVSHCALHSREVGEAEINNCWVCLEGNEVLIVSRGGTKFQLPMDQQVSKIRPLA